MNNRFKIEAKERKCWWVSIYDRQNDEYLNGFIAHSVEEAKTGANKRIESFLIDQKVEDAIKETHQDLKDLKEKRKVYESQLEASDKSDFDKSMIEAMIKELDKEIADVEATES